MQVLVLCNVLVLVVDLFVRMCMNLLLVVVIVVFVQVCEDECCNGIVKGNWVDF